MIVSAPFSKSVYAKDIFVFGDKWKTVIFPDDFQLVFGDSISLEEKEELTISIKKKREVLSKTTFTFDPSLNPFLQLDKYSDREKLTDVWGNIIDAYTWDDKLGRNVVVRSILENETTQDTLTYIKNYLYFYHFIEDVSGNLSLVRKFTDSYKSCLHSNNTHFSIESIELTDINRDTIGEISAFYTLNCSLEDTIPYISKVLMSTNGKKYVVSTIIDPCSMDPIELKSSLNLSGFGYFDRYLRKKLRKNL